MAPRTRAAAPAAPTGQTADAEPGLSLVDDTPPAAQPLQVAADMPTPAHFVMAAIQRGDDLMKLEKLLELKERWDKGEAKKAYTAAMARFKLNPPTIIKDRRVGFENNDGSWTGYSHASLAEVANKIAAALGAVGISHSWNVQHEAGKIIVSCTLTHELGHSETVTMPPALPDNSGKKNPIQQMASAVSYLERYSLLAITGLAAKDQDDDGRATGDGEDNGPRISPEQVKELETMLLGMNYSGFLAWARVGSLHEIPAQAFDTIKAEITARKARGNGKAGTAAPQRKSALQAAGATLTYTLAELLTHADRNGVRERDLLHHADVDSLEALTPRQLEGLRDWISGLQP